MLGVRTIAVLFYMVSVRLPAMKAAGIDLGKARGGKPGARRRGQRSGAVALVRNFGNVIRYRFVLFLVSTLILVALIVQALIAVF